LFISGQLPISPTSGEIKGDIREQTKQVLENIQAILLSVRTTMRNVIKTTVFLKDLGNFNDMNEIYQEFFKEDAPARSCIEVSGIPKGALVEIESIALLE
jgi:2-iminobutanoate/2-iminopropanoate deaminase